MEESNISRWQDKFPGEPSVVFLRSWFVPSGDYRISESSFPAGAKFPGSMRGGIIFIIDGSCNYDFGNINFHLSKGDFVEVPGGGYRFSVEGDRSVRLVRVYKLPQEFRRK